MYTVVHVVLGAIGMVVVMLALGVLGLTAFTYYKRFPFRHIPCPPMSNYILGHIGTLKEYYDSDRIIGDAVLDWTKEYGNIIIVYFLWNHFVFVHTPKAVKDILVTSNFPKKAWTYDHLHSVFGSRFMGYGLVTELRTERWAHNRALFNPAFHRSYLKTCIDQFNASSDLLIKDLMTKCDIKKEVVMLEELNKVGMDIIAKVAFGTDLDIYTGDSKPFTDAVTCAMKGLARSFVRPWDKISPLKSAREYRKQIYQACKLIRETGRQCIQKQVDMLKKGESLPNNIIGYIIQTSSGSEEALPDMEQMIDEFVTFFIAGQETTANLLAWTLMELTHHPEIVYRLKTEIDAVVGDMKDIAFEDLSKLEYMMAVLKESLRLHPPASGTVRTALPNCSFDGIKIPEGASIAVLSYSMSRMEEHFQNPLTFEPDRFLHGDDRGMYAYFPFSLGPRNCVGQQFALIEARIILSKLLRNFEFTWVPGQSMGIVEEMSTKPKDGCKCYVRINNNNIK